MASVDKAYIVHITREIGNCRHVQTKVKYIFANMPNQTFFSSEGLFELTSNLAPLYLLFISRM
jgi:hypothetical protein